MTVRELINELLDKNMDTEVHLFTKDPKRPDCTGIVFNINSVSSNKICPDLIFEDWRDSTDKREVKNE